MVERQPRTPLDSEQEFTFRNVELIKTETLGTGSYGAVCKAKCDELICAAKLLYPVLFQMQPQASEPGKEHRQPFRRFESECRFLSRINHPNIVQYLGTYRDPETNAPVLIMELMDESLTHFLETSPGPIPYHVQVNLSYDVAQALSFLHANEIIHRDLSSNNVLLLVGRAKVTDFGMFKFTNATHLATMTTCPGTPAFMSPEALNEPPVYTANLDNFSLGVLMVQIATQKYPKPTERFEMMEVVNPRFPNRMVCAQVPVPEAERRHAHISIIDPTHPLLPIALHCLKDEEAERPSSQQLCQTLGALKETAMYEGCSRQDKDHLLRAKDEQIETQTQEIVEKTQQLQLRHEDVVAKEEQLQAQEVELRIKDEQLQTKDQELNAKLTDNQHLSARLQQLTLDKLDLKNDNDAKERQLRSLNEQVVSNEEITGALQQALTQRESEVRQLQSLLVSKDTQIRDSSIQPNLAQKHQQQTNIQAIEDGATLMWEFLPNAPASMETGSSTTIGNKAYFKPSGSRTIHEYDSHSKQWSDLPKSAPLDSFTIVSVDGHLSSVGGWAGLDFSNKLYTAATFSEDWIEQFPPMATKRQTPTAVYANSTLVVAGGYDGLLLTTVEVLNTQTSQWSVVSSLSFPLSQSSATINGDALYMTTGGGHSEKERRSVLKCSLTALVNSTPYSAVWEKIANLPVYWSSLATLNGILLAVGGKDTAKKTTKDVYKYNITTNSWEVLSRMSESRSSCFTAILPGNRIIIVGGYNVIFGAKRKVEIARFILYL